MTTVALSGAGGQLGRFLRPALLARGVRLRSAGGRTPLEPLQDGEDIMHGDLCDDRVVDALLTGIDVLIHMAGTSVERPLPEVTRNNLAGLHAVYEGARRHGVRRVVFASSNHAIGMHDVVTPLGLECDFRPDGFYGLSKMWGEGLARLYWDKHGIESVCVRIGSAVPRPTEIRHLSTWFGLDDLLDFTMGCIETPQTGFLVAWGVSANTRSWWTPTACEALGYYPKQNAEDYAAELFAGPNPLDLVGQTHQGGGFASIDFTPAERAATALRLAHRHNGDHPMPAPHPGFLAALPGISGILVTPFDSDDHLAPTLLRPIIDRAIGAGVHILTANGNTGEFYGLTTAEAERMVHAAAEQIDGRVPLLAGVGRSIGDAVALAHASRAAGAAALMVHQPPDPFVSPRGVVAYVARIAEAGQGLPVVLYLRNDNIGFDAIEQLCAIPGVAGVKWASPTPLRLAEAIRRADPKIVWVGGLAETWAPPLCSVGARGFTSGLINVWPEHSMAIHAALAASDYVKAGALIATMSAFEELRAEEGNGTNVTVVKSALQMMGNECGHVRPPGAWPLTERQSSALRHSLIEWGLLPSTAAAVAA